LQLVANILLATYYIPSLCPRNQSPFTKISNIDMQKLQESPELTIPYYPCLSAEQSSISVFLNVTQLNFRMLCLWTYGSLHRL